VARKQAELSVAAWGAITFGALLASFSAFRPVRDALVLDGDPDQIPALFTAAFVVVTALAPLWGKAVSKNPRRVVPLALHAFALCAVAFFFVLRSHVAPVVVGRVFYVWSSVFNLFVVSVFWSLLADLLGPGRASRLYGPISAGGTLGGIAGPALTKACVGTIGVAGVLVLTAVLLELAVIGILQVRRHGAALELELGTQEPPMTGGALDGLVRIARSPFLAAIAGFVVLTAIAATFVYFEQLDIVRGAFASRVARTDYFATIDLWTQIATFVLQLLLAGPLLARFGPGPILCLLPLAQGIGIVLLVGSPTLAMLTIVLLVGRTLTHGLNRPARELLFTVVSRDDKYRAKNVIDTLIYRTGDVGSAWLRLGLAAAGAGGIAIAITTIPLAIGWLVLALVLGVGFRRRMHKEKS